MSEDKNMPDLKELYGEFIEECKELIEGMARELVDLEKNPSDEELINKIFRSAHSMKGNAGFIGLTNLSELAHKMENVLGKLRDKEFPFFAEINDILFKGLDIARGILSDFIEGRSRDWDLKSIYSDLENLLSGPSKEEVRGVGAYGHTPVQKAEGKKQKAGKGEEESASYMRVSTSRLDKLVNLVGELAAGRSRLSQLSKEARNKPLEEVTSFIASISSQIQSEVLSIRMVPIKQLFNKFYRLVRDVSRPMGKDVELQVVGEDTELDKTIIELLHDPILHMVRNAIGHGIETPEERKRLGKPQVGTVILRAYHEQNYVYVDVEDDGRGLNPDRIRKKALEKGIIGADEASAMSDDEAVRLIFLSGFSTAEEIDDISGRGVGMNVVKTNIEKVGGSIDVDYREGAGTRFILKMPLTLAIVQLFLLRDGGRYYGIPLGY
ncbi:MAG: chemotaxis protein CheA, partial [Deltaproteobacteria bacterium]